MYICMPIFWCWARALFYFLNEDSLIDVLSCFLVLGFLCLFVFYFNHNHNALSMISILGFLKAEQFKDTCKAILVWYPLRYLFFPNLLFLSYLHHFEKSFFNNFLYQVFTKYSA